MGCNIKIYLANTTKHSSAKMSVPVQATNCTFYLLYVNGDAKKIRPYAGLSKAGEGGFTLVELFLQPYRCRRIVRSYTYLVI